MRVKVKTATLIAKIESYKARCEAEIASQTAAHDSAMGKWRDAAIIAAEDVIVMLNDGIESDGNEDDGTVTYSVQDRTIADNVSQLVINVPCARPLFPDELDYQIERDLEALKACPDEVLSIGPEDHLYRYLASPEASVRPRRRR